MSSYKEIEISIHNLTGQELEEYLDTTCREGYFKVQRSLQSTVKEILDDPEELKDDFKEAFCNSASQTIIRESLKLRETLKARLSSEDVKDYVQLIIDHGIRDVLSEEEMGIENIELDLRSKLYICYQMKNNEDICRRSEVLDLYDNKINILYQYIEETISKDLNEEDFEDEAIYTCLLANLKENLDLNRFLKNIKREIPPRLFSPVEGGLKSNETLKEVLNELPRLLLKNYKRKRGLASESKIAKLRWDLIELLKGALKDDLYQRVGDKNIRSLVVDANLKTWLETLRNEPYYKYVYNELFYNKSLEKLLCEIRFYEQREDIVDQVESHLEDILDNYKVLQQIEKKLLEELSIEPTVLKIVQANVSPKNLVIFKDRLSKDDIIKKIFKALKVTTKLKEQLAKEGLSNPQIVTITIKTYNDSFFEKLIRSKETRENFDFDRIFKDSLMHVSQKKKEGALEDFCEFVNNNDPKLFYLFRKFKAIKQKSGAGEAELLPDAFEYQLLPYGIDIIAEVENKERLSSENLIVRTRVLRDQKEFPDGLDQKNEEVLFKRFMRFLKYFQKLPFTILSRRKLASAINETTKKFIGIETFMSKFKDELKQFTSKWYASPKGILLYGPPGTGKSAITKSLCEELGVVFATAPMAAGDLKKGIQGDSEKTINEISMRCKLTPWEMCVLLIDEIDSLAPDRNAPSSGTGNEDLIGVLLATMDGSKETKNLKIIASTNLLNKIDAAFLRRMEIQLFLGNPNKSSRALWIASKAKQSRSHKNNDRIARFVNDDTYSDLREMMIKSSINFSADAYRKLLDRFYDAILSYPVPPTLKNYSDILIENIRGVAEEMKIYLGIKTVIDVFESEKNFQDLKNEDEIADFTTCSLNPRQTLGNGKIIQLTKKVLVDLASKSNKEVFQVEGMLFKKDDNNELIETSKELMVFQLLDEKFPVAQYEEAWLPLILQFALEYDADIVKVIDNNFLINNNANDDSKAVALVNSIVEETKKYDKGVLIFDLDSIAQISKQFQSLKKEMKTSALLELVAGENTSSFSYSMQRPLTLFNILELFQTQNDDSKCWLFAVSSHNKLVIDFKEATEWPDTETVKEFKKNESEKDKLYRCKYCREVYCVKENLSEFKCGRHLHNTLVYEESNTDSQQKKTKIVKKEEADRMIHTLNAFPWEFKYTCCGGQYGSKGEKLSRHEEEQCMGKIIRD